MTECSTISAHVRLRCAQPCLAFCAYRANRRRRRDGFSRGSFLPMDDGGPLSPKANAFSIASLISAAEQAGNSAFDQQGTGLDKPELHNCSSYKMHYSTVTREMEGTRSLLTITLRYILFVGNFSCSCFFFTFYLSA